MDRLMLISAFYTNEQEKEERSHAAPRILMLSVRTDLVQVKVPESARAAFLIGCGHVDLRVREIR